MSEHVKVSRNGGILEITIDKPKANAIDIKVSQALGEALVTLRDDRSWQSASSPVRVSGFSAPAGT